jgi:acyl-CoA reductase-like NAD-dependent aldehyde dehydrogenase
MAGSPSPEPASPPQFTDAAAADAKLLCGGKRDGALVTPAVLDRVPSDVDLVMEETLGPVAPVIRAADAGAAIDIANSTPYGLQAGVLTSDLGAF